MLLAMKHHTISPMAKNDDGWSTMYDFNV